MHVADQCWGERLDPESLSPAAQAGTACEDLVAGRPVRDDEGIGDDVGMKKLLLLIALAGIGYVVYRKVMANKAEQDLWSEATSQPDLR